MRLGSISSGPSFPPSSFSSYPHPSPLLPGGWSLIGLFPSTLSINDVVYPLPSFSSRPSLSRILTIPLPYPHCLCLHYLGRHISLWDSIPCHIGPLFQSWFMVIHGISFMRDGRGFMMHAFWSLTCSSPVYTAR